jgi:hypothetical protein
MPTWMFDADLVKILIDIYHQSVVSFPYEKSQNEKY